MKDIKKEKELEYLNDVIKDLVDRKNEINKKISSIESEVIDSRIDMWDEAPRGVNDFDDLVVLYRHNEQVKEVNDKYTESLSELNRINSLLDSPYFGRFDIKEDGEPQYESIYVGKYSFFSERAFNYLVVDWRTPVASVYYEYDIGDVSYMTPSGEYKGHVNLKRQFRIESGKLKYMIDITTAVRDEILAGVLSENTETKLKVIISSIQKEQNAAIRYLNSRNLLVHGPAGSGKTSVGLHRLAYILYKNRDSVNSKNIVILSNNNIFNSYISNILPELGEEDVNRYVFSNLISRYAYGDFEILDYYEQVNDLMSRDNKQRTEEIRIKYSYEFLDYIIGFFNNFKFKLFNIKIGGAVLCEQSDFEDKINNYKYINFQNMLLRVFKIIEDTYNEYYLTHKKGIMLEIEKRNSNTLTEKEINILYKNQLNTDMEKAKQRVIRENRIDEMSLYSSILKDYIKDRGFDSGIYERTIKRLNSKVMYYEDCLVYLNIKFMLGGLEVFNEVKYVLIDEAQDYNILQLFFIKNIYNGADFTLLADVNQTINPVISMNRYEDFGLIFQDLESKLLHRSYRSTGPINALAFQLLSGEKRKEADSFSREGEKPQFIVADDFCRTVKELVSNKNTQVNTVGIIVRTEKKAVSLYKLIGNDIPVQLITNSNDELKEKIVLIPVMLAKGLEFDMVIVIDDFNSIDNNFLKRNILYLMCTRALHYLYFLSNNTLPEWMEDCRTLLQIL